MLVEKHGALVHWVMTSFDALQIPCIADIP